MRPETRRDLATATVGAGGLSAAGLGRHAAVSRVKAATGKEPKVHALGVLRQGSKPVRRLWLGSSALGLASTVPFAVGTTRLATSRKVEKKAEEPGFLREGLRGSVDALKQRGETALEPVPARVRGTQLGVAAGTGYLGSLAARAALRGRVTGMAKPAVAPIAGALAATGSIPVTNRALSRQGYEVTPYGVRRAKKPPVRPSSKAATHRPAPRSFREDLAKSDWLAQRAAVTAAGATPVVGPITQAAMAARYAPPGKERKHAARQWAMGPAAGLVAGAAGAYGGAALADRSPRFAAGAQRALDRKSSVENWGRRKVGMGPAKPSRAAAAIAGTGAGRKLLGPNPKRWGVRGAGAAAGFLGAKALTSTAGTQAAITLNQREQRKHAIGKRQSKRERHQLAERKRLNAALSVAGGTAGLGGLAMLGASRVRPVARRLPGLERKATMASITGGGIGGANALLHANVQRREAKQVDPFAKAVSWRATAEEMRAVRIKRQTRRDKTPHMPRGLRVQIPEQPKPVDKALSPQHSFRLKRLEAGAHGERATALRSQAGLNPALRRRASVGESRARARWKAADKQAAFEHRAASGLPATAPRERTMRAGDLAWRGQESYGPKIRYAKRGIEIKDDPATHRSYVQRYGDRGPLPKGLDRSERMRAYEARYVHHGGDKADKYGRRARAAEGVRNVGLATATAGGAAWLASKTRPGAKVAARARTAPRRARHLADTVAIAGGTGAGAAELYGEYARGRRASYTNSPAGVAGSALRRMRDYTPEA